jgi:hypothetical protein
MQEAFELFGKEKVFYAVMHFRRQKCIGRFH